MKLEALTDKDPGADADSDEDEDPSHVPSINESGNAVPKRRAGHRELLLPSSQGGEADLPSSQPQPVTAQAVLEDEDLKIEEFDSD